MKKRHYILFIAGDVEPQIIGPFASELKRDKTIRALREKHGSQHGYFRLEQNPSGSLLAAAYANSWWQEALDAGLYEINDVQDKDIDNAGPDLALARPVAESLNKIIDYLWHDEQRHFNESTPEEQKEHIFQSLQTVRRWLEHHSAILHGRKGEADSVE